VIDQAYKQAPPEWLDGDEGAFEKLLEKIGCGGGSGCPT